MMYDIKKKNRGPLLRETLYRACCSNFWGRPRNDSYQKIMKKIYETEEALQRDTQDE